MSVEIVDIDSDVLCFDDSSRSEDPIHVLVVDDEEEIREEIADSLARGGVAVTHAMNVDAAIAVLEALPPGAVTVILTDIRMPGRDGLALAEYLRTSVREDEAIEVVVMTGHGGLNVTLEALRARVFDFINKPMQMSELAHTIRKAHMATIARRRLARRATKMMQRLRAMPDPSAELASRNDELNQQLRRRESETVAVRDVTLHVLSSLVALRDAETGCHIQRTQAYVELLVKHLRHHPRFAAVLADETYRDLLIKAVPLHDIGKIGIPDAILLKPGKLTPEEFEVMKTHTTIGGQAIEAALRRVRGAPEADRFGDLADSLAFLEIARQIAVSHHEKWDGSGYPEGLAGENIPLPGRLMALADVFDALLSVRPYKKALSVEQATAMIAQGRGAHFDPDVVDVFLKHRDEFARLSVGRSDEAAPTEKA